jgi:hypothetical protein
MGMGLINDPNNFGLGISGEQDLPSFRPAAVTTRLPAHASLSIFRLSTFGYTDACDGRSCKLNEKFAYYVMKTSIAQAPSLMVQK